MFLLIAKDPMRFSPHNSRMSGMTALTLGTRAIRATPSTRHVSTIDWSYYSPFACKSDPRGRTKWYGLYTEEQYQAQRQSEERARWAASVRTLTNHQSQISWSDSPLDPPALLGGVTVVIISPRKPVSVGTVARACGSFECEDLRIVMPRQESYITRRHAKSASKGAQYILYRAGHYASIADATADCDIRIAFTRWTQASSPHVCKVDINGLTSHPAVQRVITQPLQLPGGDAAANMPRPPPSAAWTEAAAVAAEAVEARLMTTAVRSAAGMSGSEASLDEGYDFGPQWRPQGPEQEQQQQCCRPSGTVDGSGGYSNGNGSGQTLGPNCSTSDSTSSSSGSGSSSNSSSSGSSSGSSTDVYRPPRVALVFGREELGMSDEEVDSCEVCCSIPIGRLQESLSLSHAISIALCALYQARLQHLSSSTDVAASPLPAVGLTAAVAIAAEGDVTRCATHAQPDRPTSIGPPSPSVPVDTAAVAAVGASELGMSVGCSDGTYSSCKAVPVSYIVDVSTGAVKAAAATGTAV
ncbi:hypothetical protein VaNZ11_001734 [Volvox africanus]|uniref:tRNA/rRNA methyltransferase SpoU type domain-containing protein n=1 Tax=Volvox africanus TaxID=51714 RepID=A0ABQ5RQS2_9CHLO|nr:hypothetical protein VaNZ11_001734 [Volvox africanus]